MGRSATEHNMPRPSTPEIESWKRANEVASSPSAETWRRGRASMDAPLRPTPAEVPVKITRSKSVIRRKPAPEVRQEEIDSSSSTPVHGRTFRALEVDPTAASPLGGSLASSPAQQHADLANTSADSKLSASFALATQKVASKQVEANSNRGLGLFVDPFASTRKDASLPSIDVRPSTPKQTDAQTGQHQNQHKLGATTSPSNADKRLSSSAHSVTDTSLSVERPWSLISAGDADTPLLKLRKLVVNTESSDESRELDDVDGLFFRPPRSSARAADQPDKAEQEFVKSEIEVDQPRSSSQTTTRSDTKHEIASIHSSGSSTLRPVRDLVERGSISGLSAASATVSNASQANTIRASSLAEPEADSVGPLPAKSPAVSQHSGRRQHRRDGSTGSAYSQATVQQGRRASTASRLTARSSGHWSESRVSEDALSALEAEVGQARRAEVVALGKGRVRDWVGGGGAEMLPTADAPTLSRTNTLRKKPQPADRAAPVEASAAKVDEREAQRQKTLNDHLSRRLQQLSDEQDAPVLSSDAEIRDIPDLDSRDEATQPAEKPADEPRFGAPRFARLSAFHDRKLMPDVERSAAPAGVAPTATTIQTADEAIRLGRAPSKRVRRTASEAKSCGEAVMVSRAPVVSSAHRRASTTSGGSGMLSARHRRRTNSLSAKRVASSGEWNPTLVAEMPVAASAPMVEFTGLPAAVASVDSQPERAEEVQESGEKKRTKQRSYATSEEAARARQQELVEREQRQADKEARRQAHLQHKYAKKKQSDPLLAARLALAGLQPVEAVPRMPSTQTVGRAAAVKTTLFGMGLQVPEPSGRRSSLAASVSSFHTAVDGMGGEVAAVSPKLGSGSGEVRPDTSYSIASSLAVDFEFPVPPQRMKEQLSDDGTLLSRAGLQESPLQQQWRERRHFAVGTPQVPTPPRDSSLRHRQGSSRSSRMPSPVETQEAGGMSASRTMPRLSAVSPLESLGQNVALRRSRSVGYNSRDLRRITREQMARDAERHPSPKSQPKPLPDGGEQGLGIQLDEAAQRQPILA